VAPGLSEARIITNVDDRDAYQYFLIKSIPAAPWFVAVTVASTA